MIVCRNCDLPMQSSSSGIDYNVDWRCFCGRKVREEYDTDAMESYERRSPSGSHVQRPEPRYVVVAEGRRVAA